MTIIWRDADWPVGRRRRLQATASGWANARKVGRLCSYLRTHIVSTRTQSRVVAAWVSSNRYGAETFGCSPWKSENDLLFSPFHWATLVRAQVQAFTMPKMAPSVRASVVSNKGCCVHGRNLS